MADLSKRTVADMAMDGADLNMGTTGSMHEINWDTEDAYWQEHHALQPYATADRPYEFYRPAYRYGSESSAAHGRRPWDSDLEAKLEQGWSEARPDSAAEWGQVRDAVREGYTRSCR
jgi:hypothetical protein